MPANPITPEALELETAALGRLRECVDQRGPDYTKAVLADDLETALAIIARQRATLEVAEGVLTKGVSWFVEYAHGHEAKIPPDTDKANRNFGRARMLDSALTTIRQAMGRGS